MSNESPFAGPIVTVGTRDKNGGTFQNVRVEQLGGRAFLVGELAPRSTGTPDPRVGRTFWFPVDEVMMITEYPDVATAERVYAAREKSADAD